MGITIPISSGRRGRTGAKWRLLIVDQHPLVSGVLCDGLTRLGYHAVHCSNADEALRFCRAGQVDCVLAETGLLTSTGERLTARLRRELPHIAVGLLTAWFHDPAAWPRYADEVDLVLQKPIQLHQLDRALANLTASRQAALLS